MLIFFIIIIVFIISKFIYDKNKEVNKVNHQGGMMVKYADIIEYFSDYPNSKIQQISSSSIKISTTDRFVVTTFTINHGFSDYTIFWNHQSVTFGSHSLHWTFPEYMDQINAINLINSELEVYQKNLLNKYL